MLDGRQPNASSNDSERLEPSAIGNVLVEEYKSLRGESLQTSSVVSSAVWIGLSGYLVTAYAWSAVIKEPTLKDKYDVLSVAFLGALMVQSIVATSTFIGELYRFARVSTYLRYRIQPSLKDQQGEPVLLWEDWIAPLRIKVLYLFQVAALQIPLALALVLVWPLVGSHLLPPESATWWQKADALTLTHLVRWLILIDGVAVVYLLGRVHKMMHHVRGHQDCSLSICRVLGPDIEIARAVAFVQIDADAPRSASTETVGVQRC